MRRLAAAYGAHPLHLLALVACFALAGYAAVRLVDSEPVAVAVWFVGAAVGHDLVLLPLYAVVDTTLVGASRRRAAASMPRVAWLNHLRLPLAVSALLFVVFSPSILRLSDSYVATSGLSAQPYLGRWLLVTAALFGLSAVAYAVRLRRARPGT